MTLALSLSEEGCGVTMEFEEKRSELRTKPQQYHSIEFEIPESKCIYQFKIWDVSSRGSCLLVRNDSEVLKKIEEGDVFEMKFYPADLSQPPEILKTQIIHITPEDQGRFRGHHLVGLLILNKKKHR